MKIFIRRVLSSEYGLDLCRAIVCANVFRFAYMVPVDKFSNFPPEMFSPIFLFEIPIPIGIFPACKFLLMALLVACGIGIFVRATALAAAACAAMLFGWPYNFGFMHFSDSVLPLSMLALALAPSPGRGGNLEAHLFAMRFLVIFPFFAGAVSKLRSLGLSWGQPEVMESLFQYNRLVFGERFSPATLRINEILLSHRWLLSASGYSVLLVETLSPIAFVSRRAARAVVPLTLLLHLAIILIFSHNFLNHCWPLYLYWLNWRNDD